MTERQDKIALVTGGTGGIGTMICRQLCKDGYRVIANYKDFTGDGQSLEEANKWKAAQAELGFDIQLAAGNVANFESASAMINEIAQKTGPVDILINNAGITRDAPLHKMTPQQWFEVIDSNLNSVFNCSRLVIEGMLKNGWGRIINISSVNGQKGAYGQTNYSAAKSAMYGFSKSLALEVAKKGITVNCISPGYIGTSMVMSIREEIREKIVSQIPMGRFGEPEEIAKMISYLVSDSASYITGSNLAINGGLYMP